LAGEIYSWSICANDRDLVLGFNGLLGASRGTLGALSTLATTLGLWEQSLDPGLVYEVESAGETCEEEEVKEDTA